MSKNDSLLGDIIRFGRRIHVKDNSIQPAATNRRRAGGRVLLEAVLVAVMGMAFAFAANLISSRGLALARNYFPTGTNSSVRAAVEPSSATNSNPAVAPLAQSMAAELKREGLQLIDAPQAVQLFHESRLKPGIVFIDARDSSEYRKGHIPGAYEFNPYRAETYFPTVMPVCQAAEQIVVYCNGGDCDDSETAALLLRNVGIPNQKLFVYGGGLTEWTNNRLPLETGPRNSGNLRGAKQ